LAEHQISKTCIDTNLRSPLTQTHHLGHVRFLRTFFFSARRTPRFFYFPIGKSTPTDSLRRDPPSLIYQGIGTRDFASSKVGHWVLKSRYPMCQSTLTFLFPLSGLRLYRDFATRDTQALGFPTPDTRCAETRYDPIVFSQPRVLVTWSTQYLGPHPANSRVREISQSLPPVFHSLLRSHMLPCGCRDIASRDIAILDAIPCSSNSRTPDMSMHRCVTTPVLHYDP
jgi:hypothetical protein